MGAAQAKEFTREAQQLEEQDQELVKAERQIDSIIADLQDAQTVAGLKKLQKELEDKRERLKTFIRDRLPSIAEDPTAIDDLRRVKQDCRPPPSDLIQKWREGVSCLQIVWDVVRDKPEYYDFEVDDFVFPEYHSDLPEADHASGQISLDQIEVLARQQDTGPEGGASFDPMTATLRRVFVTDMAADGDTDSEGSDITAIIVSQAGRLVMADFNNQMVKVTDVTNPDTVHGVKLDDTPWALALLQDDQVAVTSLRKTLYLIDVRSHPFVVSRVQTARRYRGVSAGTSGDTLIVSCRRDGDGPASVDVISRNGDVIQTVIDSNTLKDMREPECLCVMDGEVVVADWGTNTVYRVELATGRVVATLTHPDMLSLRQVCVNQSGNVYIACSGSQCVLVMSADGQWRRLLEGSQHGDKGCVRPYGVCVTGSSMVVSWWDGFGHSVVAGYDLT